MKSTLIGWLIFFAVGAIFFLWEILDTGRTIKYASEFRKELKFTAISFAISIISFYIISAFVSMVKPFIPLPIIESAAWVGIGSIPLLIKVLMAFVLRDLTYYGTHRLTHETILWQTHKFHHSSERLWWLISVRSSLFNSFISSIGYIWYPLLGIPPETAAILIASESILQTWVHINVAWHPWMEIMELVFVTPRFHAIHHMVRPEVGGKNLGGWFTFFDRIFGTYVNPSTIDHKQEKYGLEDEPITLRMIVGI